MTKQNRALRMYYNGYPIRVIANTTDLTESQVCDIIARDAEAYADHSAPMPPEQADALDATDDLRLSENLVP
jgi:hypothetical protein